MSPFPLALLLALACAGNPIAEAGEAYVEEMTPLFAQNRALGEQLLQLASKVKKKEADAKAVAAVVSEPALSAAAAIAAGAAQVHPLNVHVAGAHAELVTAWKHRSEAYSAVVTAWKAQDREAFDKAVTGAGMALDEEAAAADHLERLLGPAGVHVDVYP
ncbi:MAG: hypothetical protein EXR69_03510 [Myxococcales bacterium]|nr:hypothetical protein [Myxococcales bacterium]